MARLQLSSAPSLRLRGSSVAPRWLDLLAAIDRRRSISAAARAVGLSYKAAWDAIEAMNNLADAPLVARSAGGRGGGGSTLTAAGRRLVDSWRALAAENARFVAQVNRRVGKPDLALLGRLSMLTSARNQFAGTVQRVRKGAVNDEIEIALSGGERLVAVVTRASTENLGLKRGRAVVALVKASWVMVGAGDEPALRLSARNCLDGTVARIQRGAVNSEVVIALPGGNSVAAIITNVAVRALKLASGRPASAIFKASSVIVGVAD